MPGLFYRLTDTMDPEERLEDACLWKAMRDHYGAGITALPSGAAAPREGVTFGRRRMFTYEGSMGMPANHAYWKDPGFAFAAGREFRGCDLEEAVEMTKRLHDQGKDVFIKSREQKLFSAHVMQGEDLMDVLGDMCWSFMDNPESLLVQERVEMREERRFVVIDRQVVTCSPVQVSLTPLSRSQIRDNQGLDVESLHFETPTSTRYVYDPGLARRMWDRAVEIAERAAIDHMIVDLATVDGRIEVIEYNPMHPGMFGLFACRPDLIAQASEALLPFELQVEVQGRKASGTEFPAPQPAEADRKPMARPEFSLDMDWSETPEP